MVWGATVLLTTALGAGFGSSGPTPPLTRADLGQIRRQTPPLRVDLPHLDQTLETWQISIGYHGQCNSTSAHPPRTPCSMCVDLWIEREIEIDDVGHMRKIEPSARHIGGDHVFDFAVFEPIENRHASALVEPAVDVLTRTKLAIDLAVEITTLVPGIAEDDHLIDVLFIGEKTEEGVEAIAACV